MPALCGLFFAWNNMADNTTLPGTGEVYASKDLGGIKYQKIHLNGGEGALYDAFGRFRTSEPETLFDSKLLHGDSQPLFWDEQLISGTMATSGPTTNTPYIDFTSTNLTAGNRIRQTFRRFNYQSGKSNLVMMTGVLELASGDATGCQRRIGAYDDDNGAFFESDAGTIGVTLRSSVTGSAVDSTTVQSAWNLDRLDGLGGTTNPSGVNFDASKVQIFVIDYQWLSAGRVRFGLYLNGVLHYVHEENNTNTVAVPWSSTPNFPLRYEIITTANSGVCSMRCICATVMTEGAFESTGVPRHAGSEGTALTTVTEDVTYALVGIRLKSAYLGAQIELLTASVQIQSANKYLEWHLYWNPTVAGTFTYSDVTNSAMQAVAGTASNTVTGGTILIGGYLESSRGGSLTFTEISNALKLGAAIDGTQDEIVLTVTPRGGSSAMDVEGMITWLEQI